jgi:flagellin
VEEFSSEHGKVTVSLLDGLQGTESLSSKYAHASEVRISRGFQTAITASSAMLTFLVDGGTANVTNITSAFPGGTAGDTGWEQAALLETTLQAATADGADTNLRVAYDSSSDEFVITDILGRELEIQSFSQAAGVSAGAYLSSSATVAQANKSNPVKTSTDATSGVMTEATKVDLLFSQDDASGVVLSINGRSNSSSAIDFNFATDTFAGSDFKTILNSMMNELNSHYNGSPLSYELNQETRTLSITHAKGGEIFIDDFVTTSENLVMNLQVVSGDGEDTIISYDEVLTSASANGSGQNYTTTVANAGSSLAGFANSSDNIAEISIATQDGANSALASIDNALMYVISERAKLGAIENRLDHTINNLSNVVTNTSAAKGRIEDADFAVESTNLTKAQILAQASTSMLAQANQSKQTVLSLLQ